MDGYKMRLYNEIQMAVTQYKDDLTGEFDTATLQKIADERGEIYRQGIIKGLEIAGVK